MAGLSWRTVPLMHQLTTTTLWRWFLPPVQSTVARRSAGAPGGLAQDGARVEFDRVIERRWVYVLDIDCHGQGTVLYPRNYAENQFPNDADNGRQFVLPGAPTLRIGPPYGVDTMILLSTAQPLPDPYALNFEGVASRCNARRGFASGKTAESNQRRNPRILRRGANQLGHRAHDRSQRTEACDAERIKLNFGHQSVSWIL